jgi:chemotaxis protein methyltransferase WspC
MTSAIEQLLSERAGLDTEVLGAHAIDRAIAARVAARATDGLDDYLRLLQTSESEFDNLVEELAVLETWFFRDSGPFDFLAEYAKGRQSLRAVSAACATGEEAYSIAMALLEAGLPPGRFTVDACDISRRALQTASRAVYPANSFREGWRNCRSRWFAQIAGGFALSPEIAHLVRFHRDNLLHPAFLAAQAPYDVVFCRNLLIYFRPKAQDSVVRLIGQLLSNDGVVFTGHAEVSILLRQGYQPAGQPRSFACRKAVPELHPAPVRKIDRPAPPTPASVLPAPPAPESPPETDSGCLLQKARQLADAGALEDASLLCRQLQLQGFGADAYYLEGVINEACDRLDLAEECFRKSLYLNPAHYVSLVQMSLLCERRGDPVRAKLFRDRAAKLAAPLPEVADARRP